jgi:hypothetical protein
MVLESYDIGVDNTQLVIGIRLRDLIVLRQHLVTNPRPQYHLQLPRHTLPRHTLQSTTVHYNIHRIPIEIANPQNPLSTKNTTEIELEERWL